MSEEKEKQKQKPSVELSEKDLEQVTGGASALLQLDGIKGESTDDKHKDWIE
jgi:bacteriocin-like protein